MATQTAKDRILEVLKALPLEATYEDAIERIVLLAKVDEGIAELDRGEGLAHEVVKRRVGL